MATETKLNQDESSSIYEPINDAHNYEFAAAPKPIKSKGKYRGDEKLNNQFGSKNPEKSMKVLTNLRKNKKIPNKNSPILQEIPSEARNLEVKFLSPLIVFVTKLMKRVQITLLKICMSLFQINH